MSGFFCIHGKYDIIWQYHERESDCQTSTGTLFQRQEHASWLLFNFGDRQEPGMEYTVQYNEISQIWRDETIDNWQIEVKLKWV